MIWELLIWFWYVFGMTLMDCDMVLMCFYIILERFHMILMDFDTILLDFDTVLISFTAFLMWACTWFYMWALTVLRMQACVWLQMCGHIFRMSHVSWISCFLTNPDLNWELNKAAPSRSMQGQLLAESWAFKLQTKKCENGNVYESIPGSHTTIRQSAVLWRYPEKNNNLEHDSFKLWRNIWYNFNWF